jgi:hypothetical protein
MPCAPFIFFLCFNKELEGGVTSEMEPEFFLLREKALLRDCCSYGHLQYKNYADISYKTRCAFLRCSFLQLFCLSFSLDHPFYFPYPLFFPFLFSPLVFAVLFLVIFSLLFLFS